MPLSDEAERALAASNKYLTARLRNAAIAVATLACVVVILLAALGVVALLLLRQITG